MGKFDTQAYASIVQLLSVAEMAAYIFQCFPLHLLYKKR